MPLKHASVLWLCPQCASWPLWRFPPLFPPLQRFLPQASPPWKPGNHEPQIHLRWPLVFQLPRLTASCSQLSFWMLLWWIQLHRANQWEKGFRGLFLSPFGVIPSHPFLPGGLQREASALCPPPASPASLLPSGCGLCGAMARLSSCRTGAESQGFVRR